MLDTQVSILKRDGYQKTYYSTYADARTDAVRGDVIRIWADLNEQIILLDGVDVWIMPGVVVNYSSDDTITDKINGTSYEVHCNIYGLGIIKNSGGHSCVYISHPDSELSIECDYIEGTGGSTTFISVYILQSIKFHLTCNSIISKSVAIYLGSSATNLIQDVNLTISKVETGAANVEGTSILLYANGFVNINEVLCKNRGHCLRISGGTIIARIKKMTAIRADSSIISTVTVGQGDGTEKLILYFDEIQALGSGSITSYVGIIVGEGTGIFIGRTVFSTDSYAIEINGIDAKGYFKCNEVVSENFFALGLNEFTNQITFDVNYIQGNSSAVVFAYKAANFELKNSKIRNVNSDLPSRVISLYRKDGVTPTITLNNVKLVTGNNATTEIIYSAEYEEPHDPVEIDIDNYGLFVNYAINEDYINLFIGDNLNFFYIDSPDLT